MSAGDPDRLSDREQNMARLAKITERKLVTTVPKYDPRVGLVWVKGTPQLIFELTIPAPEADDAKAIARYRVRRALTANTTGGPLALGVPMGRVEVTQV